MRRPQRRETGPALVARFAIGGLAAFLATGVGLSILMSGYVRQRAEAVATFHASFVVNGVLAPTLTEADLSGPITGSRYEQLQSFVEDRILSDGLDVRVKIWTPDGTVIFSDDPTLVGRVFSDEQPELRTVMAGTVEGGVSELGEQENVAERALASKLFETYVPLRLEPGGKVLAVAEVYQDYRVIQADIDRLFRTLGLTFGGGLIVLYLALLPIALRASRSLRRKNAELERRTDQLAEAGGQLQRSLDQLRATDVQRRLLLDRVVSVQEEERKRIAADIHDDSIQVMTAAAMRLHTLRPMLQDDESLRRLEQVELSIERAIARLRRLMFELRPPELDQHGLAVAIELCLSRSIDDSPVRFMVENRLPDEPSPDLRIIAYRVVQEALANARKHARGTRVVVTLSAEDGGLRVSVRDDGVGFDLHEISSEPGHLGLTEMRERVHMAGGDIHIETRPGHGTTLTFWLPGFAPEERASTRSSNRANSAATRTSAAAPGSAP